MVAKLVRYCFFLSGCIAALLFVQPAMAQRPSSGFKPGDANSDKPWIPENTQEKEEKAREKDKQENPQRPLTKRELRKKMKREEKERRKTYDEFHDKIQTKAIRKRMKENEKRSKKINNHEGPSFWQRLFPKKRRNPGS